MFSDFYTAFHFLYAHKIFEGHYLQNLYVEEIKVDPETKEISSISSRNTETRIWFETGPVGFHDLKLDCGGATYEEATIALANLVHQYYCMAAKKQLNTFQTDHAPLHFPFISPSKRTSHFRPVLLFGGV